MSTSSSPRPRTIVNSHTIRETKTDLETLIRKLTIHSALPNLSFYIDDIEVSTSFYAKIRAHVSYETILIYENHPVLYALALVVSTLVDTYNSKRPEIVQRGEFFMQELHNRDEVIANGLMFSSILYLLGARRTKLSPLCTVAVSDYNWHDQLTIIAI